MSCLFGWLAEIALVGVWIGIATAGIDWNPPFLIFLSLASIAFIPLCPFFMGLVHGLIYNAALFAPEERHKSGVRCLWVFYGLHGLGVLTLIVLNLWDSPDWSAQLIILSVFFVFLACTGIIPALIITSCFHAGRRLSEKVPIPVFLGLKTEWDRDE